MKCPYCKKEVEFIEEVVTGRATVTYRRNRNGCMTEEHLDDLENEENFGFYCPHCDRCLGPDFVEKFLKER